MSDLPDAKRFVLFPNFRRQVLTVLLPSVRRDDVLSPRSSREPSPVNDSDIETGYARLGKLLDLDGSIIAPTKEEIKQAPPREESGANEEEEQEFEFRLFSAPVKAREPAAPAQRELDAEKSVNKDQDFGGAQKLRIRLRSPTPVPSDPSKGRFVKAFRGWQYYFSTPSLFGLREDQIETDRQLERRRQFEDMAVTGQYMETWAKSQPWVRTAIHRCSWYVLILDVSLVVIFHGV